VMPGVMLLLNVEEEETVTLTRKFNDWLFSAPDGDRSLRDIILWWEARRIPYNFIVGGVGLCSLLLFFSFIGASGDLGPGEDAVEPLSLLAAPILLNICYTAGWVVEALLGRVWSAGGEVIAPRMLKFGLGLSLAFVLLPSVMWGVYWVLHIVGAGK
jgi:hypothetical protein